MLEIESTACVPCVPVICNPFERVAVSYIVQGNTTVYWTLQRTFDDPMPYQFTLQVGQTDVPDSSDWEDVGSPIVNMFFAVDGEQRVFGKLRWQFYRVKLVTSRGTYYSEPTGLMGTLPRREWMQARNCLKQETQYMKMGDGSLGYLLKRRVAGQRCRRCLDYQTQEIKQPYCRLCWGTGWECGYFFPVGCVWTDLNPRTYHLNQDGQRGTTADIVVKARMLNTWMLGEEDVYVHKATDDRFYVHEVQNAYEFLGVPVAANVSLRLAPASDPLYELPIPAQLETVEQLRRGGH